MTNYNLSRDNTKNKFIVDILSFFSILDNMCKCDCVWQCVCVCLRLFIIMLRLTFIILKYNTISHLAYHIYNIKKFNFSSEIIKNRKRWKKDPNFWSFLFFSILFYYYCLNENNKRKSFSYTYIWSTKKKKGK